MKIVYIFQLLLTPNRTFLTELAKRLKFEQFKHILQKRKSTTAVKHSTQTVIFQYCIYCFYIYQKLNSYLQSMRFILYSWFSNKLLFLDSTGSLRATIIPSMVGGAYKICALHIFEAVFSKAFSFETAFYMMFLYNMPDCDP